MKDNKNRGKFPLLAGLGLGLAMGAATARPVVGIGVGFALGLLYAVDFRARDRSDPGD